MDAARVATFAQLNFKRSDCQACGFAWVEIVRGLESAARFSGVNHGLDVGLDVVLVDQGLIGAMPLVASQVLRGFIKMGGLLSNDIVPNGTGCWWWSILALEVCNELANLRTEGTGSITLP